MATTASYTELMRQAGMTAHDYLCDAVRAIDEKFGDRYAEKHPELVAAFMKVACDDYTSAAFTKDMGEALESGLNNLAEGLNNIANALKEQ